jgi:uncharacterized protein with HEPN domain
MPQREPAAYLRDAQRCGQAIQKFTAGKTLQDYRADYLLRLGIERLFTILGESLAQLKQIRPEVAARIKDHAQIVAFRNVLVHGYASVDEAVVWSIIEEKLGGFMAEVGQLLQEVHDPLAG